MRYCSLGPTDKTTSNPLALICLRSNCQCSFGQYFNMLDAPKWQTIYRLLEILKGNNNLLVFKGSHSFFWVERCVRNTNECLTPGACMKAISKEQVFKALMNLLKENDT